ncbi:MAG TPA: hypothetical protein VEV19_11360 [Ktedonobacteraceae bacterium]|nr:hypothetical protein [Ktedonobacteraceae bacterium]
MEQAGFNDVRYSLAKSTMAHFLSTVQAQAGETATPRLFHPIRQKGKSLLVATYIAG